MISVVKKERVIKTDEKPKLISSPLHFIIVLLLLILFFFFFQSFLLKSYRIPSGSMLPTIQPGERVVVDRFAYRFSNPEVGDIVVFRAPLGSETGNAVCAESSLNGVCLRAAKEGKSAFIKRVVAASGDRIKIIRGKLFVNGKESYKQFRCSGASSECHFPEEIKVPKDHYFLLGDNRSNSYDSRFWGAVEKDWIVGKARMTYWPPDQFGVFK
jgi:signal peptidase I